MLLKDYSSLGLTLLAGGLVIQYIHHLLYLIKEWLLLYLLLQVRKMMAVLAYFIILTLFSKSPHLEYRFEDQQQNSPKDQRLNYLDFFEQRPTINERHHINRVPSNRAVDHTPQKS